MLFKMFILHLLSFSSQVCVSHTCIWEPVNNFQGSVPTSTKSILSLVLGAGKINEINGTGFHLNSDKNDSLYLHLKHFFFRMMIVHIFKLKKSFCSPFLFLLKLK